MARTGQCHVDSILHLVKDVSLVWIPKIHPLRFSKEQSFQRQGSPFDEPWQVSKLSLQTKGIPNIPIIWTAKPSGKAMPQSWLNNVSIINYIDGQRTLNSEGFKRFKNSRTVRRREF